jgi:hypothetical protein
MISGLLLTYRSRFMLYLHLWWEMNKRRWHAHIYIEMGSSGKNFWKCLSLLRNLKWDCYSLSPSSLVQVVVDICPRAFAGQPNDWMDISCKCTCHWLNNIPVQIPEILWIYGTSQTELYGLQKFLWLILPHLSLRLRGTVTCLHIPFLCHTLFV